MNASATLEIEDEMTEPSPAIAISSPPELSAAVVARFCGGDVSALGEVFDFYSGPVMTVVRSVLRDQGQAEDAVQDTFLKAWKGSNSFDPARPLGPWLFTIARRTAIDIVRKEGLPTRSNHDELDDNRLGSNTVIDLPGLEQAWEAWEIRSALQRLPEEERLVMGLSHYEGMTHPQIAVRLGIPIGTVKSRSYRAHRRLLDELGHLMNEEPGIRETKGGEV